MSCIPFPAADAAVFGLAQEKFRHNPFQLLVAVQFLNKTRGTVSMPICRQLLSDYPTPEALAAANVDDIVELIRHLGLQNQRARKVIGIAKTWLEHPPQKGKRYRTLHYPNKNDGKDIKSSEVLDDDDPRPGAWEIAHIPGCGDYAIDSWRIFCRDQLRGVAESYNGEGASEDFEPEWKRVVPKDKELREFLRWMWLRESWVWDPLTGKKVRASSVVVKAESLPPAVAPEKQSDGKGRSAQEAKPASHATKYALRSRSIAHDAPTAAISSRKPPADNETHRRRNIRTEKSATSGKGRALSKRKV